MRAPEVDFVPSLNAYLEALLPFLQQNSPERAAQVQQQTKWWQRAWRIHLATSRDGGQTFEPERVLSLEGPSLRPVLCRDGQRLDVCWFDQRNGRTPAALWRTLCQQGFGPPSRSEVKWRKKESTTRQLFSWLN